MGRMYKGVTKIFGIYWKAYGGLEALLRSPYFHLALLLLALTYNTWLQKDWWTDVISALPNLLGFTLGGFAIFIGFGDERFRQLLADPEVDSEGNEVPTIYVSLCSTFVHFIIVQLSALIYALIAKAWWFYFPWPSFIAELMPVFRSISWAAGFGLFLYALTSVLAATMHVFRIANMYEKYRRSPACDNSAPRA